MSELSREERWLAIPGWEAFYEVSDMGRVRSLPRAVPTTSRGPATVGQRMTRSRILKPDPTGRGYDRVRLRRFEVDRKYSVHRLVLLAFRGEPTPPADHGCHNNGDSRDNRLENLRWATRSSNMDDKLIHGTCPRTNQTHCKRNHRLVEPNLTAYYRRQTSQTGRSHRSCLACHRAHGAKCNARVGERPPIDFAATADAYYVEIMTGTYTPAHMISRSDADAILALVTLGEGVVAVARKFGVGRHTVSAIKAGTHWTQQEPG